MRRRNLDNGLSRFARSPSPLFRFCRAGLLGLATAGCAHFAPRPIDPAGYAGVLLGQGLAGRRWGLEALTNEAVRRHPDIAVARAQYESVHATMRTAGERPNPTLTLSPQIITPYTALIAGTYGIDLDWTVETAGKRSRRMEIAEANSRAAAVRVVDAIWKVRAAVRRAFLNLYAAEQRSELLKAAIALQDQLLASVESRIEAGEEARSANAQSRLLQAQLRLQGAEADKQRLLARAQLAQAIGIGEPGLARATFSFAPFEGVPALPSSHRKDALVHRADVLAALADYAAAEGTVRLEVARQYPDIHLIPGYQLDAALNKWSLGVGMTLPLLNQNQGPIGEAEAKRKEAEARFNAVQARALGECDLAVAAIAGARAKFATANALLAAEDKEVVAEQRLLSGGEGDKLALLSAQVERATTLTARLDALVEMQAAAGALEEATQTSKP